MHSPKNKKGMTIEQCYDEWSQTPEWKRLAKNCKRSVQSALLKEHGDLDINELSEERLDDLVREARCQYFEKVQTKSVMVHLMFWAAVNGHFAGKVPRVKIAVSKSDMIVNPNKPIKEEKHKVWYHGTIYTELHNHGRRSNGSSDGNRTSVRFVKGVGMTRSYGYRWVAEIHYKKKRYRCRSYSFTKVRSWLDEMSARFS